MARNYCDIFRTDVIERNIFLEEYAGCFGRLELKVKVQADIWSGRWIQLRPLDPWN